MSGYTRSSFIAASLSLTCLFVLSACSQREEVLEAPQSLKPKISFAQASISQPEGNRDTIFQIEVRRQGEVGSVVSVNYRVSPIEASPGLDYVADAEGTLRFQAGETAKWISVQIIGDTLSEPDEKLALTLVRSSAYIPEEPEQCILTLLNDDLRPVTGLTIPLAGYTTPDSYPGYTRVWEENFDSGKLDPVVWNWEIGDGCPTLCGWGNNELQFYRQDNVRLQAGYLLIEGRKESAGGKSFTSSRLTTQGKKSFRYGRVDIRAAVPTGRGYWPALWMLGENLPQVSWPACGEIDIMECRGDQVDRIVGAAHFGSTFSQHRYKTGIAKASEKGDFGSRFHVFSILWEENSVTWLVDDLVFLRLTPADMEGQPWPFNQPFFFIVNLAIGGNFPGAPDAQTPFPSWFIVDYLRVFQKK